MIDWASRPVVIVGGGPSVRPGSLEQDIRGRATVVAINDAFRHLPWADAVFTIDIGWLRHRWIPLTLFAGQLICPADRKCPPVARRGTIRIITLCDDTMPQLNPSPDVVHYGENSGHGALTFAAANGARRIYLLGFDMNAPGGHWFGEYEWHCRFGARDYPRWIRHFAVVAPMLQAAGVDVCNLNPLSAIRCFRFGTLAELVVEARHRAVYENMKDAAP
jgi:hypothetical protein